MPATPVIDWGPAWRAAKRRIDRFHILSDGHSLFPLRALPELARPRREPQTVEEHHEISPVAHS